MDNLLSEKGYYVDGRVSIKSGRSSFIGPGKIELIEKIKELGSLRKAAAEMKMSYRQAWLNISELNKFSDKPLVILKRGGRNGGIAQVTEFADKVILAYKNLQTAFADFLREQTKILESYFFKN
jgi:molybdate transport system regulatory protein